MLKDYLHKNVDLKISETLNERKYSFNMAEELSFDFETINDDMREHTQIVSLISGMLEERKQDLSFLKLDLDKIIAQKFGVYKSTNGADGKPLSDKRVEMLVDADERVLAIKEKIINMQFRLNRLMNAVSMFSDRKDLMQSFNTNYRKQS